MNEFFYFSAQAFGFVATLVLFLLVCLLVFSVPVTVQPIPAIVLALVSGSWIILNSVKR